MTRSKHTVISIFADKEMETGETPCPVSHSRVNDGAKMPLSLRLAASEMVSQVQKLECLLQNKVPALQGVMSSGRAEIKTRGKGRR